MTSDRSASRALLGRGSIYTIATAFQLAGALVVQLPLTRVLDKPQYGIAALGVVITATLGLVLTLGLPGVITREYFQGADGEADSRRLVTLCVGVATVGGAIAFVSGPLWAAEFGGFEAPFMLATATAVSYSVIVTAQAVQRARNQPGRFVLIVGINVLGGQLAGFAAALLVDATATAYLAGVAAGSVVGAGLALAWARPAIAGLGDRTRLRRAFALALPTVPHMAALYLMAAGDRFIVRLLDGDEAVGEYNIAYLVGALGITLVAAANNAWAPLIYAARDEQRWNVLATTTSDMLRFAALAAAGLAVTAPLALWLAAPADTYPLHDLVPVVAVTALATVPYVLYLASVHVLFWTGRTVALLWVTPVSVAANLGAKYLVLPHFGFVGAAVVTVAAYGLLALLVGLQRRLLADVRWHRRWPEMLGAAVLCLAGAVIPPGPIGYAVRAVLTVVLVALLVQAGRRLLADRRAAGASNR